MIVVIRKMRHSDVAGAVALQKLAFPPPFSEDLHWDPEHLHHHIEIFPAAQLVASSAGEIVGSFINTILDFVIVAFCLFLLIKVMNRLWKKPDAAPAGPTTDQKLLMEIRDVLKAKA